MNNKLKATALLIGVLYLLYGGKLVNVWREKGRYIVRFPTSDYTEEDWGGGGGYSMEESLGRGQGGGMETGGGYGYSRN